MKKKEALKSMRGTFTPKNLRKITHFSVFAAG